MITDCACVVCWHVVAVLFRIIADGVFQCVAQSSRDHLSVIEKTSH